MPGDATPSLPPLPFPFLSYLYILYIGGGKRAGVPDDAKTAKAIEQARAIAATLAKQTTASTAASAAR